ncbi:thioredoxin domain-containing protein [Rhizobium sp. NLR4a]|uniref:thioredoxin domain-containing protein n=2 Tax=Rhizobium TaxID=379 RepID=UPI00287F89BB|nr:MULTISPECIES: thioredoxin domain-containing protein [Rhizobium]
MLSAESHELLTREIDMSLGLDSHAPPLEVENQVRGEPLKHFQPGKVYVVEFWAAWCGKCMTAMPSLMQLQHRSKPADLRSSE